CVGGGGTRRGFDPNGNTPESCEVFCCRRSIRFAQQSRPPDYRQRSLGNQRAIRPSRQKDSRNPSVWEKWLRWFRCNIWGPWRGAFRQHAPFESHSHPKSWSLASVLYANESLLNDRAC